jgi:hypothetical protein
VAFSGDFGRAGFAQSPFFAANQIVDLNLAFAHLVQLDIVFGNIAGKLRALHLERQQIGGNRAASVDIAPDE